MSRWIVGRSRVGPGARLAGEVTTAGTTATGEHVRRPPIRYQTERPFPFTILTPGDDDMADTLLTVIGPYDVGEIPEPTDITVSDSDGNIIDLTAATGVTFKYTVGAGTTKTGTAAVTDATGGVIRVTWSGTEFSSPGTLRGRVWYTLSGTRPVAAKIVCDVVTPPVVIG